MPDNNHSFDETKYEQPSVNAEVAVFSVFEDDLKILLVKRRADPFSGMWAIPGGFVNVDESVEDAAMRELQEETGVEDVYMEQLYTWGDPDRDPRKRVIAVSYLALMSAEDVEDTHLSSSGDVSEAQWFSAYNPPDLAFDHDKVLQYAIKRLRWKLEYTTVAFSLLPEKFTLTELQNVYEIVFDRGFDKRNFRKKVKSLGLVEDTGERRTNVSHRPPKLYRFNQEMDVGEIVEIL